MTGPPQLGSRTMVGCDSPVDKNQALGAGAVGQLGLGTRRSATHLMISRHAPQRGTDAARPTSGPPAMLARISHRIRCIGAWILRESCCSHGFLETTGSPNANRV